ncbi:MAG: ExbD/TolR family protein [Acidithiobacillus ferriphilus]|jgi:outer membrane transport energization protein ExbD (TC 2.C.1.1.1)|uniref:Biopolymer transporter ExbD n=3 Tax=Acidithiobacillus TaxID=119977 RepID=A0A179BJQ3_ACIFR|nr:MULTISPECIES: biopolymer transporter ExbD [Acidithiobacillus]MDA8182789.1 biopolymer transporter ExbD [Acidithiobacillus sp.]OYV81740.1 MAG: biopolymer transporter ExbD [Acidithiobacillus ferrivorans]MBU2785036.1 biopolymer transporter ExbD [Acidithiobacillus ferriphilus]MBU2827547.1 biopolymer transporter ExbD [Acidithiobacillus ferriphilus]MBU2830216.1 biopolymer transporter ExbD [Acidithiobacillus ferriphilus]
MERRYFEQKKGRVEIIPMIDIMLFLLVFFIMITLQMIPDKGLNLQLPTASRAQQLPHPHYTINIDKDGSVNVKGHRYDLGGLQEMLASDSDPGKTQITIVADKGVPFQNFVHVMDRCQKAGVSDIGIAAKASN